MESLLKMKKKQFFSTLKAAKMSFDAFKIVFIIACTWVSIRDWLTFVVVSV